jgi:hypothetical protein
VRVTTPPPPLAREVQGGADAVQGALQRLMSDEMPQRAAKTGAGAAGREGHRRGGTALGLGRRRGEPPSAGLALSAPAPRPERAAEIIRLQDARQALAAAQEKLQQVQGERDTAVQVRTHAVGHSENPRPQ